VGAVRFDKALRSLLDFGDRVGIEEFAKIGFTEELAKLILVDGEGLGAALRKGRVAIVDEVGDVAE